LDSIARPLHRVLLMLPAALPVYLNGDGTDDVVVSAATSLTDQGPKIVAGNGSTIDTFQSGPADSPDQGPNWKVSMVEPLPSTIYVGRAHVCTPVTWPYRMTSSPG